MSELVARPTWKRWITPCLCALVFLAGVGLPPLWDWADLGPALALKFVHAGLIAAGLATLVALLWFFVFGGFTARTRLTAVGLAVLAVVVAGALIGEVDWTGNMRPIPRFRWQARAQDLLERHRQTSESGELATIDLTIDAVSDFPRYRGAQGDGVVTPPVLLAASWEASPPMVKWRQPCGGGFAGFAVVGNVAITMEQRRGNEVVVCYDRDTGRERWANSYPAHFRDVFGDGPRATPTIHEGRVYSYGATGVLSCIDGKTGERVWAVDTMKDCQAKLITWGMSGSPLVVADEGLVIVNPGVDPSNKADRALAAYDMQSGQRRWAAGSHAAGYQSPQLASLAGKRQVVIFDAGGLAGSDLADGSELWRHPWETFQGMNIIQPILFSGDRLLVSSEASNGCAMLQVAKTKAGYATSVVWENKWLASKFSNPVAVGGAIYGLSQGTLVCLDALTGKRHWRGKHYGHGQILAAGGAILILGERGQLVSVKADTSAFTEQGRMDLFADKTWNTPALAGRHLYVRNAREMACVELPAK